MKAALLYGVKDIRVEDYTIPKPGVGEVLVKIKAATTCGTDIKIFQRGYVGEVIKLPTIFGHEWAGDVVELGGGDTWLEEGMRVRAGNSTPCFRCTMCWKGKFNLCENMIWIWGAYAEYIKIPAPTVLINTQEIPSNLSYEEAAATEPLACVLHGIEEAHVKPGDTVAIIGAGPIGLLHLQLARKYGADRIIISDLVDERLKVAKQLGADITVNSGEEELADEVRSLTKGYGADVVIEAIGLPATWVKAFEVVRKGGTVLEFGGCPPRTKIEVSTELLHYGELSVKGVFHAMPRHFRKALSLISSGGVDVKPLITGRMRLKEISDAFNILTTSKKEIKIAIHP